MYYGLMETSLPGANSAQRRIDNIVLRLEKLKDNGAMSRFPNRMRSIEANLNRAQVLMMEGENDAANSQIDNWVVDLVADLETKMLGADQAVTPSGDVRDASDGKPIPAKTDWLPFAVAGVLGTALVLGLRRRL